MSTSPLIVYYSTKSGYTKKFASQLGFELIQIPQKEDDLKLLDRPFILITPTYGGGELKGAVPTPVIRFLNNASNRKHIIGVISTGNRTFGSGFCLAGRVIAHKCKIPNILDVELFGTPDDVNQAIRSIEALYYPQQ